jgi:hypothetical protein
VSVVRDDTSRSLAAPARRVRSDSLTAAASIMRQLRRNLALQDYAVMGLIGLLTVLAWQRADGPDAPLVRVETMGLLLCAAAALAFTRGAILSQGPARAVVYRVVPLGTMIAAYLVLRLLLPALHPVLLDAQLTAIDERLFGKTPSVWLDRFVQPTSVEWFAFFYFSHYWLLSSHLFGTLMLDRGRRRYELLLATGLLASVGHALYVWVPGAGPYTSTTLAFDHALAGGVWWARVKAAVTSAGAGLDIFPSMHTGFSVLIALHAVRYRREAPFSWTWVPTVFCVSNIVIATLFLRWHYGVDVIAGALLAWACQRTACYAWRHEGDRAAQGDRQEIWEPVLAPDMAPEDRRWLIGVVAIQALAVAMLVLSRP